jgi:hypothetical protein
MLSYLPIEMFLAYLTDVWDLQFALQMLQEIRCSAAHHCNFADIVVIIRSEARMRGTEKEHAGVCQSQHSTLSV